MRVPSLVSTLRSAEPGYCSFAWAAGELGEGERDGGQGDRTVGQSVNSKSSCRLYMQLLWVVTDRWPYVCFIDL